MKSQIFYITEVPRRHFGGIIVTIMTLKWWYSVLYNHCSGSFALLEPLGPILKREKLLVCVEAEHRVCAEALRQVVLLQRTMIKDLCIPPPRKKAITCLVEFSIAWKLCKVVFLL